MMEILEDALAYGSIHIAASKGFLYYASYKTETRDPVTVKSDRGFRHLYMLLASAISGKQEIAIEADMIYQYPLSHISDLTCNYERMFRHAFVKMYKFQEEIRVQMQYVNCNINGIPGLSSKEGTGATIQVAPEDLLTAEPRAIFAFLSP